MIDRMHVHNICNIMHVYLGKIIIQMYLIDI